MREAPPRDDLPTLDHLQSLMDDAQRAAFRASLLSDLRGIHARLADTPTAEALQQALHILIGIAGAIGATAIVIRAEAIRDNADLAIRSGALSRLRDRLEGLMARIASDGEEAGP